MANYPFATIEPNTGVVTVPIPRLDTSPDIVKPQKSIPAAVEFLDIAGLVKGASQGEGLGNQFLANIREVDAIVHVIRCFDDPDVQHVTGSVDPVRDREIIGIELWPRRPGRRREAARQGEPRTAKSGDAQAKIESRLLQQSLQAALAEGRPAAPWYPPRRRPRPTASFNLLTAKPVLYAANVLETRDRRRQPPRRGTPGCHREGRRAGRSRRLLRQGRSRAQRASPADRAEFLASLGVTESGLDRLAKAAYHLLGLQSYFTAGEKRGAGLDHSPRRQGARRPRA